MRTLWIALFCLATLLLSWTYVLYPVLVQWLGQRARRHAVAVQTVVPARQPSVAVLIAAYNESAHIGERVRNLLQQDYPREQVTVLIGSDGSTDDTVAVAHRAAAQLGADPVSVVDYPLNRGKASVLNDLFTLAESDLLVFSDANTVFAADTLRRLVEPFDDPRVGAVCGELLLQARAAGGSQDHAYWSIERRLKAAESAIGGLLGANGGVYAIRRKLFQPLERDMICDDFVIAMNVAAAGWKTVYCAEAMAIEHTPQDEANEFHRRVRIGIGNYQALFRRPVYLFGSPWVLRFTYFSHKVLRWFTPLWLLALLISSGMLSPGDFFAALFCAQLAGYSAAGMIYLTRAVLRWPAILRGGMLFIVLNAAFVVAFVRYLRGDYRGSWRRTVRG